MWPRWCPLSWAPFANEGAAAGAWKSEPCVSHPIVSHADTYPNKEHRKIWKIILPEIAMRVFLH